MGDVSAPITGGCLCGAVRYGITGAPVLTELCHCKTCRRAAGAPMMAWAAFSRREFEIVEGKPAEFVSSPGVVRTFCRRCGTSMTLFDERFAQEIYVAIGSFDEPQAVAPEVHIWRSHRLPWLEIADDLPRYMGFKVEGLLENPLAEA